MSVPVAARCGSRLFLSLGQPMKRFTHWWLCRTCNASDLARHRLKKCPKCDGKDIDVQKIRARKQTKRQRRVE